MLEPIDGPVLRLSGIRKRFGTHEALAGIDLEIARGEVVVIIGPSGSGKSTLLRCINLLGGAGRGLPRNPWRADL